MGHTTFIDMSFTVPKVRQVLVQSHRIAVARSMHLRSNRPASTDIAADFKKLSTSNDLPATSTASTILSDNEPLVQHIIPATKFHVTADSHATIDIGSAPQQFRGQRALWGW